MKNTQIHLLLTSIAFLVFSYRTLLSKAIETTSEWIMFVSLIILAINLVRNKEYWFAYFVYMLLIFFNPYFLTYYDIQEYGLADVAVALLFGLLFALWNMRTHNPLSETRSKYFGKQT